MACFLVTASEAIVTVVAAKVIKAKEIKNADTNTDELHIPLSKRLGSLSKLLGGGSFLLAFEHLWHGEIQPFFPFLTAASSPESTAIMLHEMSTIGVAMAAVTTFAWACAQVAISVIQKRPLTDQVAV
jgi:hypothetical protein